MDRWGSRIYDDPNHGYYGPVRRLWVIFQGLGLTKDSCIDSNYYAEHGMTWDMHLAVTLHGGMPEAKALRRITYHALDVLTLPDCGF